MCFCCVLTFFFLIVMYLLEAVMYSARCTRIEACKKEIRFVNSFMKDKSFKL